MISVFSKHSWLNHTVLEAARVRDPLLFTYLDEKQRAKIDALLVNKTPLTVLKDLLDSPHIPSQLVADLIAIQPELVLEPLPADVNENTLLHHLVSTKDTTKVIRLLEAMFNACYLDIPNYQLDCEKKNKQGLTVLDLALSNASNDIVSAILLYGNPKNLTLDQQNKLVATKIDIGAIARNREQRALQLAQSDHKTIIQLKEAVMDNLRCTLALKREMELVKDALMVQQQQNLLLSSMIVNLYKQLNIDISPFTHETKENTPTKPLRLEGASALNTHHFFAKQNNVEQEALINTNTL